MIEELKNINLKEYGTIPFWSWNNKIEKSEIIKQIHQMHQVNCGGFIIHARNGLKTEYLSQEWFNLISVCLAEAKKLDMAVWLYDENGWPSGFCGGKLLEKKENLAPYLSYKINDYYDENAYVVYGKITDKTIRLNKNSKPIDNKFLSVYLHFSPSNVDILNPNVVSQFISETHEKYYERFAENFGQELVGFFTDEPQYYRYATPFSTVLEKEYLKKYRENLLDGLYNLFSEEESSYPFRSKYYNLLNELYTTNYYKRIYDWCEEHNCKLTGHSVEESQLTTQMWGGANCVPSYEFEHIPAIDNLCKTETASLSARQVGSLAGQLGKKHVLTETFGCSGYDATPKLLKSIVDKQFVHGVNLVCQHLFPYSLAGQGKTDHPPCFSKHITWWNDFKIFNTYIARLGYLLSNSETKVNCAVINPIKSVYLKYNRLNESSALIYNKKFEKLQKELNGSSILYDLIDENILRKYGSVFDNQLIVGKRKYDFIILPDCDSIDLFTYEILSKFLNNNGKLLIVNPPKYLQGKPFIFELSSNVTLKEIKDNSAIKLNFGENVEYTYKQNGSLIIIFAVNVSGEKTVINLPHNFNKLDLCSLEIINIDKNVELDIGESILLVNKQGQNKTVVDNYQDISDKFIYSNISDNVLTLDEVSISFDGVNFGKVDNLQKQFDEILRNKYKGKLYIKYPFNVVEIPSKITLVREKEKYLHSYINGEEIFFEQCDFDYLFEKTEISKYIQKGLNEYFCVIDFYERDIVSWALYSKDATESVKNCLYYDTMIENVYLLGNFSVSENRSITKFLPPSLENNLQEKGFPNFSGWVEYQTKINNEFDVANLLIDGNYMSVEVFVNDIKIGSCMFDNVIEIPLKSNAGNIIKIKVISSLRNTFGPFHFDYGGQFENGVSPVNFHMRGLWQNGECKYYQKDYKLQPFGINKIQIGFSKHK